MRVNIVCNQCSKENNAWAVSYYDYFNSDGVYKGTCWKGHYNEMITQTLKHEMLFDIALNAIADHYYREAISSFASSVERYFEFAIQVLIRHRNVSDDDFSKAWKLVSAQSERQLGAYIFSYMLVFGTAPHVLSQQMTERRNNVIHRGLLPSLAEAREFGNACYDLIQDGVTALRRDCLPSVNAMLLKVMTDRIVKHGGGFPCSTQVSPTALNIIADSSNGYLPYAQVLQFRGIATG